jgi:hypothetical protein
MSIPGRPRSTWSVKGTEGTGGSASGTVASNRTKETTMRVMVMVKASPESEAGVLPTEAELAEMGAFNEQLVKAGVMLAGEGLHPTSGGVRMRFEGGRRTFVDGPFTETKEIVGGFWLWQVKDMDEAREWARRCPPTGPNGTGELEIRRVFEADDFGEALTPELRAQEERLRAEAAKLP